MKTNVIAHIILTVIFIFTPSAVMSKNYSIVFVSEKYGHPEIFSMNIDGSNLKRLTNTAKHTQNLQPSVSPSGNKIVFVRSDLNGHNLYIMKHDGTELKQLTFFSHPIHTLFPVWSPDGTNIAFVKIAAKKDLTGKPINGEIFLVSPDDKKVKQLTKIWEVSPSKIDWHRKENKIMFVTRKWGGVNAAFIIDPKNQNDGDLVPTPSFQLGYFSFSPEATTKVLCAGFVNNRQQNIYSIESLETTVINGERESVSVSVSRLTNENSSSTNSRQPSFSPDGEFIIFTADRSGTAQIYVMDADGKNERIISAVKENEYDPTWFPHPDREVLTNE